MANARIVRPDDQPQIDRGNGAVTVPLLLKETGARSFISGISIFQPGVAVPLHSHNVDEMVTVLEGTGECEVEGESTPVRAFDTSFIPAGEVHCFRNTGSAPMRILWVYAATDVTRTFADTGETVPHLSAADRIGR
jgi:quercetin dioxygenase-like cupin family protein